MSFFDIDETLINIGAKGMSPKTRETLQRLQEKGIKICIATGRSPMEVTDFSGVEFDAYLIYNDIEMPETVGIGIAIGNGSDRLKEIAGDICGQVGEDGIYQYCAEHGLILEKAVLCLVCEYGGAGGSLKKLYCNLPKKHFFN